MTAGNSRATGILLALVAAVFWGLSGTCAQFLFEQKGFTAGWLVCWRLLLGGSILVGFGMAQRDTDLFRIWKNPRDAAQLLVFALAGMVAVQFTYFYSISLSNAATATVLQYIGPIFVVGFYAVKQRRWPTAKEYGSLLLALMGTFLLVTHGNIGALVISQNALFWGLLSAFTLAFYTIQPVQLLRKYSATTVTGWGMLIGGIVFSFFTQPWVIQGRWDLGAWVAFAAIIIFGSVIAFLSFLKAVNSIGAPAASLLCSVEPLAAAAIAVVWLNVPFTAVDWLGTVCIITTVVLLTVKPTRKVAVR